MGQSESREGTKDKLSLIGTSPNGAFILHMEVGKTEFCVIHVYEIWKITYAVQIYLIYPHA